jgi:hypothetical protein
MIGLDGVKASVFLFFIVGFGILIGVLAGIRVSRYDRGEQGIADADDQGKPEARWRLA